MKKKLCMSGLLLLNFIGMLWPWFKGVNGIDDIYGTIMLNNPIAFCCMILAFVGIWISHEYGQVIVSIGWLGMIFMQIYECFTWHIRLLGGSFDLGLSLGLCYPEFYMALACLCITYMFYRVINHKEKRLL